MVHLAKNKFDVSTRFLIAGILGAIVLTTGCQTTGKSEREARRERGYVFYLDGAGGGGITNWAGGVRDGLKRSGYEGSGEMFTWQTGLGVVADQRASNRYKRDKAAQLVRKIVAYQQEHPGSPITLIALSAGTAVTVFTLEALPSDCRVENVILLSGSLSATYDLTTAMQRVHGKIYVTTSKRDVVLSGLLPVAGTADRGSGTTATIGVEGPRLPESASAQTRQLYDEKLAVVPWRSEFARYGHSGGHTGTVSAPFVQHYVAPLVATTSGRLVASATPERPGDVINPTYQRWAQVPVGSWVVFEGQQVAGGATQSFKLRMTLVDKSPSKLILEREYEGPPSTGIFAQLDQTLFVSAKIAATDHPLTHPTARVTDIAQKQIRVGSNTLQCQASQFTVAADFSDWGSQPNGTLYLNESVVGGVVELKLETVINGQPLRLEGRASEYHLAGR